MINIDEMATFCKAKGFVFPNSEIYGGLGGFFDFGPLGVELKENIKRSWWKRFVQDRDDVVGIDGAILSHPKVWKASGHVDSFADKLLICNKCGEKFRADHFIEDNLKMSTDGMDAKQIEKLIHQHNLKCTKCGGEFGDVKQFNLMFKTYVGPEENEKSISYLRPETAQLIFTNFKLVNETSRTKLPFGIAQMGKAFRNEISPREFLFRVREFEQMEIEFFIHPDEKKCGLLGKDDLNFEFQILTADDQGKKNAKEKVMKLGNMLKKKLLGEWHAYWLMENYKWFLEDLGIKKENLRLREHLKDELAHYSSACFDIEYKFPFGWKEMHGNANRGQFDLKQHEKESKKSMEIFDEATKTRVIPRVIEPSQGVGRAFLALMFDAYEDDKERGNIVLKIKPALAPVKLGVFPLVNKLNSDARRVYDILKKCFVCSFDRSGSVGRRYARADEQGIPYCITFDFDSLNDKSVTIRERNTTKQIRVKVTELQQVLFDLIYMNSKFEEQGKLV